MKVLLVKDAPNIGVAGDVKEVRDGYAVNFLIPSGVAKMATREAIIRYKSSVKKQEEVSALQVTQARQIADALKDIVLEFKCRAGQNDHLFGSLTKEQISAALDETHRILLDKKMFDLPRINVAGDYDVGVNLGNGIRSTLKIRVVSS